jgi:hypothetical protein
MQTCSMKDGKDLCLTIYNDDFGLVMERRALGLGGTEKQLQYLDVAQKMELESLQIDGIDVAEVNYEYDLVNREKLLEKYVGEAVFLVTEDGKTKRSCRLLASGATVILEDAATGEVLIDPSGELVLPKLPNDLAVRPALIFQLHPVVTQEIGLSYLTKGLSWTANYVVELLEKTFTLDAWVEITNEAGISFNNARLKLLAGTVNRIKDLRMKIFDNEVEHYVADNTLAFSEKSFSDYHLYTIRGTTTLKDNQVKQVKLFGAANVSYLRFYEIPAFSEDARIVVEFENTLIAGLGRPFPAGTVKVYQRDAADQGLTFVGEDQIGHTPKDEKIRLEIGAAFDLLCERKCVDKRNDRGIHKERWQIRLRNHKEEPASIRVLHRVPGTADITKTNHPWERRSVNEIQFIVEMAVGTTKVIEFTTVLDERVHMVMKSNEEE